MARSTSLHASGPIYRNLHVPPPDRHCGSLGEITCQALHASRCKMHRLVQKPGLETTNHPSNVAQPWASLYTTMLHYLWTLFMKTLQLGFWSGRCGFQRSMGAFLPMVPFMVPGAKDFLHNSVETVNIGCAAALPNRRARRPRQLPYPGDLPQPPRQRD
jgi:hypothetical protein